jgi:hypothetical protein
MTITPLNVAELTEALRRQLDQAPGLEDVTVERSESPPDDPSLCPRLGVYRARYALPARTLGMGNGFRGQRVDLLVLATDTNHTGATCEESLELLVQKALAAILNDTTIGGMVQNVDDLEVRYEDYARTSAGVYMQRAVIMLTAIGMVSVS